MSVEALAVRDVLDKVLAGCVWNTLDIPDGAAYLTWLHSSSRWAVVLCVKGEAAGQLRVSEMDERYRNVARTTGEWFTGDLDEVWRRLWESGAPDVPRPARAVMAP